MHAVQAKGDQDCVQVLCNCQSIVSSSTVWTADELDAGIVPGN